MHELGIALRIADIARSAMPPEALRVEAVDVRIGKLTAVVHDSLRFLFGVVIDGTPLAGASLRIEEVPVMAACRDCKATTTIDEPPFACGGCGGRSVEIVSGRELVVTAIELADPPEPAGAPPSEAAAPPQSPE